MYLQALLLLLCAVAVSECSPEGSVVRRFSLSLDPACEVGVSLAGIRSNDQFLADRGQVLSACFGCLMSRGIWALLCFRILLHLFAEAGRSFLW